MRRSLKNKYNTTHKYYDRLIYFLNKWCSPRTQDEINSKIYFLEINRTSLEVSNKFRVYANSGYITLSRSTQRPGFIEVKLESKAVDFHVNESEIVAVTFKL